jgi:hypothetical protein
VTPFIRQHSAPRSLVCGGGRPVSNHTHLCLRCRYIPPPHCSTCRVRSLLKDLEQVSTPFPPLCCLAQCCRVTLVLQLREAKSLSTVKTVANSDVKGDVQFANFSLMEVPSRSYNTRHMSHLRIVKRHPLHNAARARPHGGTSAARGPPLACPSAPPPPPPPPSFKACSFLARRSWTSTALLPVRT